MSGDDKEPALFAGEDRDEQDADGALLADGNGFALVDWSGEAGADAGKGEEEGRSLEALREAFAESRQEDFTRQGQALKASMAQAAAAEPEEEAKIRALARAFDAPPEMARHYREQFEAQARNERLEALSSDYPKTAEYLSELDHARLAHDDVENMTALEAMFAQPEGFAIAGDFGARADKARIAPLDFAVDAARNLAAGTVGGVIKAAGSTASFLARSLPMLGVDPEGEPYYPEALTKGEPVDWYEEAEKAGKMLAAASGADALYRFGKKTEEAIAGEGIGEYGLVGRSLLSGFRSLGNMLPAAAASFAAGGPALSLVFAGVSEGGEAFMDDVLAGKRLGQATVHGMVNGGIEAATEFLPMSRLIKEAAAGTPFVSLFLRNWARETPSELVATAGQTLSDRIAGMEEGEDAGDVFLKWLEELPENELETAISVIPMSLGFSGAARVQQIGAARSLKKTVERFNRLAGESRLRSRSPEDYAAMAGFLAGGSGVTHAYIDAGKWISYFQEKGMDPKAAAEQYGALNYGEAAELGVSLMIPFGRYQAGFSGSEHAAAFTADTKFDEKALTAEEGEKQKAKSAPNTALLAGMLHELGEESKTSGALGKAVEQLTEEVAGQLALRFGGENARAQASILARAFVHPVFRELMARAEEAGKKVSPEEVAADTRRYFEGYGLVVEANAHAAETAQQYGQREGLFDLPGVPITRISGSEFGEDKKAIQAGAMAHLNAVRSGVPIKNRDTKWALTISRDDWSKIAKNKEQTLEALQAVFAIEQLAENAVLAESHEDKKYHNPDMQGVHRMYAPLEINGVLYRAKLTVRDYTGVKSGEKTNLHAIEKVEIERRPDVGPLSRAPISDSTGKITLPSGCLNLSISEAQSGEKTNPHAIETIETERRPDVDLLSSASIDDNTGKITLPSERTLSISELLAGSSRHDGTPWDTSKTGELRQEEKHDREDTRTEPETSRAETHERRGFTEAANPGAAEQAEANRQYDEVVAQYRGTDQWMKAPNGKPTKLSERQWVQARTANFKRWLGFDWERESEAQGFLRALQDHAGNLERAERQSGSADSRLFSALSQMDTFVHQVRSSLSGRDDGGTRELHKSAGRAFGRLAQLDPETGEPQIYYHGSKADIGVFDPNHPDKKDNGWLGKGIYLTSSEGIADIYSRNKKGEAGRNIMPLFARLKNPYIASMEEKAVLGIRTEEQAKERTAELIRQGYDGIIAYNFNEPDWIETKEVVVFAPEQVKSAIGNMGTFSESPPILYQRQGSVPVSEAGDSRIGIEEARQLAEELAAAYRNAPELVVVEKPADLPFDAPDNAQGAYWRGRCFLIQRNITSAGDARNVFAHEVIGHYGLRGFFGKRLSRLLDNILFHNKNVQEAARQWIKKNPDYIREVRQKKPHWSREQFMQWRRNIATEEALAQMAGRGEKISGVKKLVYAIQKLLRAIGLWQLAGSLEAKTDAEALMALHKAELFVRSGKNINTATATDVYALFARSAMKSVEANIARGKEAMNKALLDKTSVHHAMFRNGLGWVDFVWGSTGSITDSGWTKGAMGISHILEARQRKDGLSETEAIRLLHHIVEVIAKGEVFSRDEIGNSIRVGLENNGHIAWLTKPSGNNAWVVTGYEKNPDGKAAGRATDLPTSATASRTRDDTGAGIIENISQNDDSIDFHQEDDGQAGAFWPEGEDALDEDPHILHQFIGEKGAAELDRAEEASVRLDNLEVAQEMEAAGRKAKVIKLATGWERGADGKWRYEISDAFLRLNLPQEGEKPLGEVLIHPELFMAYPDLKGLSVVRGPILFPAGAAAFLDGDTIFVDRDLSPRETASALLHEVQHAIQEREGFARGAAPDAFETDEKGLVDTGRDRRRYVKPDMAYKAVAGEVEARNAQRRAFMTPEQRMYLLAKETEDVARKDQIILHQALLPAGLTAEEREQGEAYERRGYTASVNPSEAEQAEANRQYDEIIAKYKNGPLWLKAPNGKPTKLTERQWVQARTANFKEEFGDWEKAGIRERLEAQTPVEVADDYKISSHKERKAKAVELLDAEISVQKNVGLVKVSKSGIRKSFAHSTSDAKLDVIPKIREILEQATYLDTLQDFTGKDIQNHYFATRIKHGGQTKLVFLRVRKMPGTENQLYVHDVFVEEEIKAKAGNPLQIRAYGEEAVRNLRGASLYKSILQEIYSTVNLSISKAVNKNGEPAASWWQERGEAGKGQSLHQQVEAIAGETGGVAPVSLEGRALQADGRPVVLLDGTELGVLIDAPLEEHIAAARRFHDVLAEEIKNGKTLRQPQLEKPVRLSSREWRKNVSAGANKLKWQLFPKLREIIEGSRLIESKDARGRYAEHYTKWHWCETPVLINGEKRTVGFALLEDAEGNLFYNLNADPQTESPRKHQRSSHGPGAADTEISTLEQSMADEGDGVNLSVRAGWDESGAQDATRGALSIFPDRRMRIELFKDADYSTFVHETAHFMLEVYRDLANAPGASAYIRKEYAAILRYLDAKPGQPITRRQHEKFARAFERYLMEGKAPSAAMRGVFSRFRDWLLEIYRYFIRLDVALSDDIRAVFDRMLATDGEIAFMRQAKEMEPLFGSARAMGADGAAFADYQEKSRLEWEAAADALRARAMRQRLHEGTRAYRKAYERMKQRAADAYDAQLAAKALYALTAHEGFSLNAAKLRQVYGEDFLSLLPVVAGRRIYGEQGDLLLEDAAGALGFDSGDAMIRAIARLPEREAFIREDARRRMLEEEARDLRGETLAASLEGALGNAHRLERLKAELGFLARLDKSGKVLPEGAISAQFAAMQQEAADVVAGRQVGHLKPSLYFQAMQAAARKAREAVDRPRPNYGEAIRQKRTELMNLLLFREASRVLLAVRDGVAQAEAVATRPFEEAVRTRDAFCVAKAKWLAARLHLGGDADALLADMRSIKAGRQEGDEAFLDDAAAGPVEEMTAAAALDALGAVQACWKLARRLQVMAVDGGRVALSRAAGAVAARLRQSGRAGKVMLPAVSAEDGVMAVLGSLRWHEARMATFCRLADNLMAGESAGPLARYVFDPLKKAAESASRAQEGALGRLDEALAGFGFVRETIAAPELGMTFGKATGYGKAELVYALLYMGSVSGLRRLVTGRGRSGFMGGRPDMRRWAAFLSRMAAEGRLTREDYDRVQVVWDVFAGLVPRWQQAHEALFGRAFDGGKARPFMAFDKMYRGGFVPVADAGPVDGAGRQGAPLALDLPALRSQLGEMAMFAWAAPVGRDVSRLLEQGAVQAAFEQVAPGWLDGVVKPWLACCMQPYQAFAGEGLTVLEGWAEVGRLRAGAATLLDAGAEALMRQGMGAPVFARVKPSYVASAFQQMAKDRAKTARAILATSSYMQSRLRADWAAFSEGFGPDGASSDAGLPALAADMFCAPVVWAAAYHQALAEEGLAHAAAVSLADGAVRQALGADAARRGAVWQDGGAFASALALFQAYFSGQAQGRQDSGVAGKQAAAAALLLQMAMLPVWSGEALCRACGDAVEAKAFGRWLKDAFGWGAMDGEGLSLAGRGAAYAGKSGQPAALAAGPVFYPPFVGLTDAACRAMAWVGPEGAFDSARFAQDMAAFWGRACGLPDVMGRDAADDGAFSVEAGKQQIFYQQR